MSQLNYHVVGTGRPILLLHGAAEDSGMLAGQAAAFAAVNRTVITYDRRGTGTSTRADWPEGGVAQHADDAAALLRELDLAPATVLGFSSGGVIGIELALRHPEVVTDCLIWEPAAVGHLPDGPRTHADIMAPIEAYVSDHPGDWTGAYRVMLDVISEGRADFESPLVAAQTRNAEAALRDDARIITRHRFAPGSLRDKPITVVLGKGTSPAHAAVADQLTAELGRPALVVDAATDHEIYLLEPTVLAEALADR